MMNGDMGFGFVGILLMLVYVALPIFLIWAVLSVLGSLNKIAEGQKETGEALKEIARKLGEK